MEKTIKLPVGTSQSSKVDEHLSIEEIFKKHIQCLSKKPLKEEFLKALTKEEEKHALAKHAYVCFHSSFTRRRIDDVEKLSGIQVFKLVYNTNVDEKKAAEEVSKVIYEVLEPNEDKIYFYYRGAKGELYIGILVNFFSTDDKDFKIVYEYFKSMLDEKFEQVLECKLKYTHFDLSCNSIISSHHTFFDNDAFINKNPSFFSVDFDYVTVRKNREKQNGKPKTQFLTDKGNPYYQFIMKDIIEFYKEDPTLLQLGKGFEEQNQRMKWALKNTFHDHDAKGFAKRLLNLKKKYDFTRKFIDNWGDTSNTELQASTFTDLLFTAIQAGYNRKVNGQKYLKKVKTFIDKCDFEKAVPDVEVDRWLSDGAEEINDLLVDDRPNLIVAKTSIGKTRWAVEKYCKEYGNNVLFASPLVTLAKDVEENYEVPSVYGEHVDVLTSHKPTSSDILGATYDSINKVLKAGIIDPSKYTLIIDEAHNLVSAYQYRKVMKYLIWHFKKFKRVILLTATPIRKEVMDLVPQLRDLNTIVVDNNIKEKKRIHIIQTNSIASELKGRIESAMKKGNKTSVFYQNCEGDAALAESLKQIQCKSLIVNSYTKYDKDVQALIENQDMGDHDVLICTSAGAEGTNYKNKNIKEVHIVGLHPASLIQQYVSRFRNALEDLDVYVYYTPATTFRLINREPQREANFVNYEAHRVKTEYLLNTIKLIKQSNYNHIDEVKIQEEILRANQSIANCDISKVYKINPYDEGREIIYDQLGIATTVQKTLDECEKCNPFLFVQAMVKYGFEVVTINKSKPQSGSKLETKIYWNAATSIVQKHTDGLNNESQLKSFATSIATEEDIRKANLSSDYMVIKNLSEFYTRVDELTMFGYSYRQAFDIVLEEGKNVRKVNDLYLKPLKHKLVIEANMLKTLPQVKLLKDAIVEGKKYKSDELTKIINNVGKKANYRKFEYSKRPLDILKYIFNVEESRGTNSEGKPYYLTINGLASPKVEPDFVNQSIIAKALKGVQEHYKAA